MPIKKTVLRPKKVSSALSRRWFEWRVPKFPRREVDSLACLGTDYGHWIVPVDLVEDGAVCYCVGTGADISFEIALVGLRRVEVRSFEAVANLAKYARNLAEGHPSIGVHHTALALADGPVRMQVSHVAASQSVSAAGLYDGDNYVEVPGRTLESLMAQHGDERVDILKVDIEGLEYELVPPLDLAALGVKVFCLQVHHNGGVAGAKALVARLAQRGYDLVACYPTVKLTFVRRDLLQRH
jgi:FkbM family methyltransferase